MKKTPGGAQPMVCRDDLDTRLRDMPFVCCEKEAFNRRTLCEATNANTQDADGDLGLRCLLFNNPYTYVWLMGACTHQTNALEFETRQQTAARNP